MPMAAICDKGKYDTSRVRSSSGIRACIIAHTSLTLLCVNSTAFGFPVVPDV